MTSGPEPDWIAEVVRAWMSLPLIVSRVSLMPSAFSPAGMISYEGFRPTPARKSFHRSQWTVLVCA